MTELQNTNYGRGAVYLAKPAQPSGKQPQRSFSQMADARLKLGYLYYTVDLVSGQELYMNYDESSTEEDPVILAEGIDIHGNAFRQKIRLNEIDVKNASLAEMTALNLHLGKQGDQAIKSHYSFPLETLSSQCNLTDKMDFEQYFQQNNKKLQSAGFRKEVELYKSELERYLFFQKGGKLRKNKAREHVLFEKEETDKTGVFSNKTLAEAAELKLRMAPRTAMFTPSRTEDASGTRGGT